MASSYLPDWAHTSWSGPAVRLTLPPASFFKFPPSSAPAVLPPPPNDPSLAHPFTIPTSVYNALLSPNVPITVALAYITTITFLNGVNRRRNNKPWAISQTSIFTLGVLLHNLILAVYSAWTCIGMANALRLTYVHHSEEYGLAGAVDSLCKLHGPRGMSSAATYNPQKLEWNIYNTAYHLSSKYLPESTDVGRIWNEGLSFYGWLFYLSKFYEVIDTLIIIAKGKRSSFLQTYHHAGAMMCMWAGIRYMSPPIWMFVLVNSFIHTIMYTFYFFTALSVRVPKPLKQALTTLQITQFLLGFSFAVLHLFLEYQVPVKTPYIVHIGQKIAQGASALGADAASQFSAVLAAATATADTESWLKKFALRAAGREGLAENVVNQRGQTFGADAAHAVNDFVKREEVRYHDELRWTHCLDTSGQAFAIYLNILYLLPLTWLFVRFFINSYIKRVEAQRRRSLSEHVSLAGQSFGDARRGVGRRLSQAFGDSQGWNGEVNGDQPVVIDGNKVREELRKLDQKLRAKADEAASKLPSTEDIKDAVQQASQKISNKIDEVAVETPKAEDAKQVVIEGKEKAKEKASEAASETKAAAEQIKKETAELVQSTSEEISKSTGMDLDDVLKRAWETVDSSKGKSTSSSSQEQQSASSTSQQAMSSSFQSTSSSFSEISSTTVFESSSISRSAQDNVIDTSQIVRDEDVNTETGEVNKEASRGPNEGSSESSQSTDVSRVLPYEAQSVLRETDPVQHDLNRALLFLPATDVVPLDGRRAEVDRQDSSSSGEARAETRPLLTPDLTSGHNTTRLSTAKPAVSSLSPQSLSSVSSSGFSEQDPFDEFSQTRPASSGSHASPSKTTAPRSPSLPFGSGPTGLSRHYSDQMHNDGDEVSRSRGHDHDHGHNHDHNQSSQRPKQRSISPLKHSRSMIPGPSKQVLASISNSASSKTLDNIPVITSSSTDSVYSPNSRKWHSRRRGQQMEDGARKTSSGGGGSDTGSQTGSHTGSQIGGDVNYQLDPPEMWSLTHRDRSPDTFPGTPSRSPSRLPRPTARVGSGNGSGSGSRSSGDSSSLRASNEHEEPETAQNQRQNTTTRQRSSSQTTSGNVVSITSNTDNTSNTENSHDQTTHIDSTNPNTTTTTGSGASNGSSPRESRRQFNERRDEIEDVTANKGDDDSMIL